MIVPDVPMGDTERATQNNASFAARVRARTAHMACLEPALGTTDSCARRRERDLIDPPARFEMLR